MGEKNNKSNTGVVVGIIIVILMLITGAFYFYSEIIKRQEEIKKINEQNRAALEEIAIFEKDLNSIEIDGLGKGINEL